MRIGILTHYYNTSNYGGALQAYALVFLLKKLGFEAEQICFDFHDSYSKLDFENVKREKKCFKTEIKRFIKVLFELFNIEIKNASKSKIEKLLRNRKNKFRLFLYDEIQHSKNIYYKEIIKDVEEEYDIFITGSDQVWNFDDFVESFFLGFIKNKLKIAYAASTGRKLNENEINYIKEKCNDFKAISLREKIVYDQLKNIINCDYTLDPTLLLERIDWDKLAIDLNKITTDLDDNNYILTYFLGDNKKAKDIIKKISDRNNIKLVDIPFTAFRNLKDLEYAQYEILDAGPKEFITLIKNAKYIFTDSFHAAIFSIIYNKQFYIFEREGYDMMERIYTLNHLFDNNLHIIKNKNCSEDYIASMKMIDYKNMNYDFFNEIKNKSIEFISKNIK